MEPNQPDMVADAIEQFNTMLEDPQTFALIVGPVALLVLWSLFVCVWVFIKRRREAAELSAAVQEADRDIAAAGSDDDPSRAQVEASAEQATAPEEPAPTPEPEPEPESPEDVEAIRNLDHQSWLTRLNAGLAKTRNGLTQSLSSLFSGRKLDDDLLEEVHEALFKADVGVQTADRLVEALRTRINGAEVDWDAARGHLRGEVETILSSNERPVTKPNSGPMVILVVGVNGVGKTTTIAKLAAAFLAEDKKLLLCAADTYRAAAIDQLKVWGDRLGVEVVAHQQGSDPAAVAYDAVKAAVARDVDILLIDTAGRLHSKKELMAELGKINRVIGKDVADAPHETWLVIDATTGQNALMQVKAFKEVVKLSGLVVTKLDGTAKGGVVIGASDQFDLPIRYVGVGEQAVDLRPFSPKDYAEQLF